MARPLRLLVVCLGNICRSPLAEGALRAHLADAGLDARVEVDSAGTGDWHAGEPPDARAIATARRHGVDIARQRARRLRGEDFADFDWLLCADRDNLREVRKRAPAGMADKAELLMAWAGLDGAGHRDEIPDPYTGGRAEFEHVWTLVDRAAAASVARLHATLRASSADGASPG